MHEHENVFITAILAGLLIAMLLVATVYAQAAPVVVDLSKAQFRWTWVQGTGGMVEKWIVKCGPTTGAYTLTKDYPDPALRQVPLSSIITTEGTYFCMVLAANAGGSSGPSPEASFRAVKVPDKASTFDVFIP